MTDDVTPPLDPGANPPAVTPPATTTTAGPKWFEAEAYTPEERTWLAARGLAEDDPLAVVPKLVKGHRAAEQRLGRGLDTIMDKPGKDQPLPEWLRANAATLGLPEKEDGYAVDRPEFLSPEVKWDDALDAKARKLAFEHGVPPAAHKAYVQAFAEKMQAMDDESTAVLEQRRTTMMAELQKDFGDKTPAVITRARQAADFLAEKAGISGDALQSVSRLLGLATGDAATIRLFAAVGEAMGEDRAVALGQGGPLTMTPAEARAELAVLQGPTGDYAVAVGKRDLVTLDRLKPRIVQLTKIAAG